MTKSLRQRLQLWHAIILSSVLVVFALAFYRQLHHATMSEIDGELLSGARVLEGALRAFAANPGDENRWNALQELTLNVGTGRRPRPNNWLGDGEGDADRAGPPPGPPPRRSADGRAGSGEWEPGHLGPPRDSQPYFAIFAAEGKLLRDGTGGVAVTWAAPRRPLAFRNVGGIRREVVLLGPDDTSIVVGRDVSQTLRRLNESLIQLVVIGSSVLGFGLLGGWWLAGKIIQPIQQISDTAGRITAQSLSGRIDTSRMDTELQSLGGTLNSMLGRLEASFERQNQFTADASHELRTPISVLLSHCELSLARARSDDEYRQTIAICQAAAERMRALVDSLLTLARADAGQMELQLADVDLHKLAAEAVDQLAPFARERHVAIDLQGGTATCRADGPKIAQVIVNLLHNAILYNKSGGSVRIHTASNSGQAILRVEDDGPGIPSESLPHLFDRFYRVDASRSRQADNQRRSGSGLGLAICQSIIDAHGGSLTATSQVDVGSQFEMQLPQATDR